VEEGSLHVPQDVVVAGLEGDVEVLAQLGQLCARLDQSVCEVPAAIVGRVLLSAQEGKQVSSIPARASCSSCQTTTQALFDLHCTIHNNNKMAPHLHCSSRSKAVYVIPLQQPQA